MCTHNLFFFFFFFEKKIRKMSKNVLLKIFVFYNFKDLYILHGQVFVMLFFLDSFQGSPTVF